MSGPAASPRPRLLVLSSTYPRWTGDPEPGFVHELARRLTGDFEVLVLAPHAASALVDELMDGVRVHRYRYAPAALETLVHNGGMLTNLRRSAWKWLLVPGFLVAQRFAMTRALRRFKPDVVHAHWLIPQGLLASSIVREPVVMTSHGADLFGLPGKTFAALRGWVVRRAEAVTVVSAAMRERLLAEVPQARVEVMPMGVDVEQAFVPDATVRQPDLLLFVGRLVEKKGLRHLIEALPAVLAARPQTTLRLIGFGPEEAPLRQRVRELGLDRQVQFLGALPQSQLAAHYRQATLFVAPFVEARSGDQEGLGLVVAEAMACGCPVLVGDVPAARDLVTDATGVRVCPDDHTALARAIVALLENPDARQRYAAAGREHVCQHFGWDAVARGYAALLLRHCKSTRSEPPPATSRATPPQASLAARATPPQSSPAEQQANLSSILPCKQGRKRTQGARYFIGAGRRWQKAIYFIGAGEGPSGMPRPAASDAAFPPPLLAGEDRGGVASGRRGARSLTVWLPALRVGSGAEVFVQRLEQGLRRAGHQPVVQWFDRRYELMPWRLRGMPPPAGTDVVHAGSWQGFAFRRPGIPLVVTEHQYIRHPTFVPQTGAAQRLYHRLFVDRCVARSYRAADALVAVSEHVAAQMRADLRRPVQMIYNWVDSDRFSPGRSDPRGERAPFRLLFVGNPSRWKGADVLAPLAAMLGSGFEIQCLAGLRGGRLLDACDALRRLPPVPPEDMPEVYRQCDAVLVPTRYEAFGYVALEAMACGKPVVGFAGPGTAEVCVHGQTALLAPVDDVDALSAYVRALAASPALCASLGAAGRQRALEHFSEARAIAAYSAVYRTLSVEHRGGE